SAQIREILISESAWEEMTCLFAPSLTVITSSYLAENRSISVELSKDNQKILPTTNYRPALISRGLSHSCPHLILPRVCH
ncbi:hypothetical protein, partial [Klebsiella pneumoniae]|uniref:hypothetical protein n=1 Tax=Klebsiella pneumoniae TaxID=573 RepID=UPI00235979F1